MSLHRIATVGYLNALPLTAKLDRSRYDVSGDLPVRIAAQLAAREVDVALVPVAAVLDDPELRIVPGFAIGADGPVTSVLLVAETPPEEWTELLLDGASRTSQLLTRVLLTGPFGERLRDDLVVRPIPPGQARELARGTTASLVIGDPARELPARLTHRLDLGVLWKEWTGLPFVFAVWAAHGDLDPAVRADLRAAGQAGLDARDELVETDEDRDYLHNAIRYALDDRALMGLRRFAALARRAGQLPPGEVNLFGPAHQRRPDKARSAEALNSVLSGQAPSAEALATVLETAPVALLGLAADEQRRERHGDTIAYWDDSPTHWTSADLLDDARRQAIVAANPTCLYVQFGNTDTALHRARALLAAVSLCRQLPSLRAFAPIPVSGPSPVDHTAADALRLAAAARLLLPVEHIVAPEGSYHLDVLQTRLHMGSSAVAPVSEDEAPDIERHIREAGLRAVRSDPSLDAAHAPLTDGEAIFRRQPWARVSAG